MQNKSPKKFDVIPRTTPLVKSSLYKDAGFMTETVLDKGLSEGCFIWTFQISYFVKYFWAIIPGLF